MAIEKTPYWIENEDYVKRKIDKEIIRIEPHPTLWGKIQVIYKDDNKEYATYVDEP